MGLKTAWICQMYDMHTRWLQPLRSRLEDTDNDRHRDAYRNCGPFRETWWKQSWLREIWHHRKLCRKNRERGIMFRRKLGRLAHRYNCLYSLGEIKMNFKHFHRLTYYMTAELFIRHQMGAVVKFDIQMSVAIWFEIWQGFARIFADVNLVTIRPNNHAN